MWRQAKVTVGDQTADQARVNFGDRTASKPEVMEWPERLEAGAEVKIGDETRLAGRCEACAGMFHVELLMPPEPPAPEPEEQAPPAKSARTKGAKS